MVGSTAKINNDKVKKKFDFGLLPLVAIRKIYEYLDYSDIKIASQTCYSWREAMYNHTPYMNNTVIQLTYSNVNQFLCDQSSLPLIKNLHLKNIDIAILDSFTGARINAIHELTLEFSELDNNMLSSKHIKNLKKLTLIRCSLSTFCKIGDISNITHLTLIFEKGDVDKLYDLYSFFPKLEYLNLKIFEASYKYNFSYITETDTVAKIVGNLPLTLKEFHLWNENTLNAGSSRLSDSFSDKDFKKLTLQNVEFNNQLKIILKSQKNLIYLNLSNCNLQREDMNIIANNLGLLEELILESAVFEPSDIEKLSLLKKLRVLNVSSTTTNDVIPPHLMHIALNKNEIFRELYMKDISIRPDYMITIIENLPNLTTLDLGSSKISKINDDIVHCISEKLINLKYINLCCSKITNRSLIPVSHKINKNSLNKYVIGNLKNLSTLILSEISCINDNTLIYGLKFLNLKTLMLDGCEEITGKGLEYLGENCPKIEFLSLRNSYIGDYVIDKILNNFNRIKKIDIRGCTLKEKFKTISTAMEKFNIIM